VEAPLGRGQRAPDRLARVADDDIHPPVVGLHVHDQSIHRVGIRQVHAVRRRAAARRGDPIRQRLQAIHAPSREQHVRAGAGQQFRRTGSDARRGSGDEHDATVDGRFEPGWCGPGPGRAEHQPVDVVRHTHRVVQCRIRHRHWHPAPRQAILVAWSR
jgi:hypothetical protein